MSVLCQASSHSQYAEAACQWYVRVGRTISSKFKRVVLYFFHFQSPEISDLDKAWGKTPFRDKSDKQLLDGYLLKLTLSPEYVADS